MATDYQR